MGGGGQLGPWSLRESTKKPKRQLDGKLASLDVAPFGMVIGCPPANRSMVTAWATIHLSLPRRMVQYVQQEPVTLTALGGIGE